MDLWMLFNTFTFIGVHGMIRFNVTKTASYPCVGDGLDSLCPTLFDVSEKVQYLYNNSLASLDDITINIMDGQNGTALRSIKDANSTGSWHPCLPKPMDHVDISALSIVFDPSSIHDLNDWFPYDICSGTHYNNTYMFAGNRHVSIYNLIIDHYFPPSLGIAQSITRNLTCTDCQVKDVSLTSHNPLFAALSYVGVLICDHCQFINIVSSDTNSLFYTQLSVYLRSTTFRNVTIMGNIVSSTTDPSLSWYSRSLVIDKSRFIDVYCGQSVLNIIRDDDNRFTFPVLIELSDTELVNISTEGCIVYDGARMAEVRLSDILMHVERGSIYHSYHTLQSEIWMNNVSLSVVSDQQENGRLFTFQSQDSIHISNMNISYVFDVEETCAYNSIKSISDLVYIQMDCANPVIFMENDGQLWMRGVYVDITLLNDYKSVTIGSTSHPTQFRYAFDYSGDYAFIRNTKFMQITNMFVMRSISYILLYNSGEMEINSSSFNMARNMGLDPNELQSHKLISHHGSRSSTLFVYGTHFAGTRTQIWAQSGEMTFIQSVFTLGTQTMNLDTESVVMRECQITNSDIPDSLALSIKATDVELRNNMFSGFDAHGVLSISHSSNVLLWNNTFIVNDEAILYAHHVTALESPVLLDFIDDIQMLHNTFLKHSITNADVLFSQWVAEMPWVSFWSVNVCMTGNIFNKTAFEAFYSNITSCFRPDLIRCARIGYYMSDQCMLGIYGYMERSLFHSPNVFTSNDYVIYAEDSHIAMDNVHATLSSDGGIFIIMAGETSLLLVDSYVNTMNISYVNDQIYRMNTSCAIMHNLRLREDPKSIAKYMLYCGFDYLLNDGSMLLVDSFSITKIRVAAMASSYYPGDLLKFEYHLLDKLDNIIIYENLSTQIDLATDSFSAMLPIEADKCAICDTGLLLSDASLQNIGTEHTISIAVENTFIAAYDSVSLTITACPIGYNPDANTFQCQKCNTGYYNLSPNNTDDCASCDPDTNRGIQCAEGGIHVAYNHWMALDGQTIVSAECVPNFCCGNEAGCAYIAMNKDILCAGNRDYTSRLCGLCKEGYSESLRSTQCVKCDASIYFKPMIYPMVLALLWAIYLILSSSDKLEIANNPPSQTTIRQYLRNQHFMLTCKILFVRNILYYEQALSQILSANPFSMVLIGLTEIFNLSISSNNAHGNGECFFKGMNAKHKILMDLLTPTMIVFFCVMAHVILKSTGKHVIFHRTLNFSKSYMAAFILMIGNILSVIFRLMHCQLVGPFYVHYYFGNETCYQMTWILCLLCLLSLIAVFVVMMLQLKKLGHNERSNEESMWNVFVNKYKPQCFWWEFVLFMRRIAVALFSVSFGDINSRIVFVVVILVFMGMQFKYEPFIVHSANEMELWLLSGVIVVIVMEAVTHINMDTYDTFRSVMIVVLILLPFGLMLYYIARFVRHKRRDDLSIHSLKERVKYLLFYVIMYYAKSRTRNVQTEIMDVVSTPHVEEDKDVNVELQVLPISVPSDQSLTE
eukprot:1083224_1